MELIVFMKSTANGGQIDALAARVDEPG